jgi:hypothetical protein
LTLLRKDPETIKLLNDTTPALFAQVALSKQKVTAFLNKGVPDLRRILLPFPHSVLSVEGDVLHLWGIPDRQICETISRQVISRDAYG